MLRLTGWLQVKEATRGMVEALRAAAAEHPHLNLVQRVEREAGVKLAGEASRPGSAASAAPAAHSLCRSPAGRASAGGSRPGSGASSRLAAGAARSPVASRPGSCASARSAAGAGVRGSPARAPSVVSMQLQL